MNEFMLRKAAEQWANCQRCPLSKARERVVYGSGSTAPELLIVGEAPGENENREGVPFVGPAGALLRRALASKAVGISEERFFITNTVACFPADSSGAPRKPAKEEREACLPRLHQIVGVLRPRVVLLLGATAGHWFGLREVGENRGLVPRDRWPQVPEGGFGRLRAVVMTYHPSAILRAESRVKKRTLFACFVNELALTRKAMDQVFREEQRAYSSGTAAANGAS